jgi:hypothetical protein
MKTRRINLKSRIMCWLLFTVLPVLPVGAQSPLFDSDKPAATFNARYSQQFNTTEGWNYPKFYGQWNAMEANIFTASDIASGYLQFSWIHKRLICSKTNYNTPYIIQTDIDYTAGSSRGGVVIRANPLAPDQLQEPAGGDPGFNREGIAFYPSDDGSAMIVQFTGAYLGEATTATRIAVPAPAGVANMRDRGILRIEDFGASIYVYYNDAPFIRINLDGLTGSIFTAGTVYNSDMQVAGTFTSMEVEAAGKVAVAQRDAALRLYSATLDYNTHTEPPFDSAAADSAYRDLYTDTWVATDAVGRNMPSYDEVGPVKEDKKRVVSIFYITWHTEDHYITSHLPYSADVTKILKTDPSARLDASNPLWTESSYHWGEPEMGYFLSQDEYVIRKDMAMLANAGVDLLVMDVTNAVRYWDEWEVLFTTMQKMKLEGNKVPKFCFWAFNGPVITVVQDLYDQIYKNSRFSDLWFYWEGKPLILYNGTPLYNGGSEAVQNPNPHYDPAAATDVNNPHYGDPDYALEFYTDYTKEVKNFFTARSMWWGYYQWAGSRYVGTEDNWSFGYDLGDPNVKSLNPDALVSTHSGRKEEAAVTPAQHPSSLVGKSWRRQTGEPALNEYDLPESAYVPWLGKEVTNPEGYGIYYQDRWDEALASDPDLIYINDWNEWTAGKYPAPDGISTSFMRRNSPYFFVDQYNGEFNRCLQPMKDGYTDNYYMQMAQNIRKYKGIRPGMEPQTAHAISIDGLFDDWQAVTYEFRDAKGDVVHRDHNGYGGLHYTNETGRNDIILSKVAFDDQNISFYVKTAQPLSPSTDPNWMLLFLDVDRNKGTGWEGYDFVINYDVKSGSETTVSQWDGVSWTNEKVIPYSVNGDEMEISVPRQDILLTEGTPEFYFHWSDNPRQLNDISCFFTDGESAPDRRFNYNYSTSKIQIVPQSAYKMLNIPGTVEFEDYDNGGAGVAYQDATIGNSGGAYRPTESVDIETKAGGGYDIGWINSGEWLEYTVHVNAIGKYTAAIHYAAGTTDNAAILYVDNKDKSGIITFPSTGNGQTWSTREADIVLEQGEHHLRFLLKNASGDFKLDKIEFIEKEVAYPGDGTGLMESYWTGTAGGREWFVDSVHTEIDSVVNEAWADVSPGYGIGKDFWNVRWEGLLEPLFTDNYTFYLTINDMGRLWINDQLVVDGWTTASTGKTLTGSVSMTAGEKVPIRIDFAEKTGDAYIKLEWSSTLNPREVVPQSQLFPVTTPTDIYDHAKSGFSVYPNPAVNQLTVDCKRLHVQGITIIDMQGRMVYSNREAFSGIKTIPVSLEKGIYLIRLEGNETLPMQKIAIE